jgi:hypothetical protein
VDRQISAANNFLVSGDLLCPPAVAQMSDHWLRRASLVCAGIATALLSISANVHSPNLDEPGHLAAGCLCLEYGIYDLYKVNPPLVKCLAALPVVYDNPVYDWRMLRTDPGERSESAVGGEFVEANGKKSFWYFTIARWALLSLWCMGCLILYQWAALLGGPAAGFAAVLLWCFSIEAQAWTPTLCADSSLASLSLTSAWLYRKWILSRRSSDAMLLGLCLGLTVLAKSSGVLWFLIFPVCLALQSHCVSWHLLRQSMLCLMVSLMVLNCGYGFDRTLVPLGDFHFFSKMLAGPKADGSIRARELSEAGNRFSGSLLGKMPVPVPASFLEGVDLQKCDFESRKWSYLRGTHQFGGWWYWYLYAILVKTPVATLLLAAIACIRAIWSSSWRNPAGSHTLQDRCQRPLNESLMLLVPAICFFAFISFQTGFSRYLRYQLPCYPFVIVWVSQLFSKTTAIPRWLSCVTWGLLTWSVFASVAVFPHSMSYFNELAFGPQNGPAHLIDASTDWGQDILFLADWQKSHPEAKPLYLSVNATFDPGIAGLQYEFAPLDSRFHAERHAGRPPASGPQPGWYAISVHRLYGRTKEYAYLFDFAKTDMVGYSIYIYHLTEDDVASWKVRHP